MIKGYKRPEDMSVETIPGNPTVVRVSGEIDFGNWEGLETALIAAAGESPRGLIIDLSGVAYMDSSGIQGILKGYHSVCRDRGGWLVLVLGNAVVRMIFGYMRLEDLPGFRLVEDMTQARAVFG